MESTDKELVEASLCGDTSAFETLYRRYWKLAFGVAIGVCSDKHLAEDATQEAFATVASQLDSLREPCRFVPWLRTICRRTASRQLRRLPQESLLEIDPPSQTQYLSSDVTSLREGLAKLDEDARELLALRHFSELTHDEIATALEITSATQKPEWTNAPGLSVQTRLPTTLFNKQTYPY